jgi:hypothetical protein
MADGTNTTVGALLEQAKEVEGLRQYKEHASRLMAGDAVPLEQREESVRFVMSEAGYEPSQIDEYWSTAQEAMREGDDDMADATGTGEQTTPPATEPAAAPAPVAPEVQARLDALEARLSESSVDQLKVRLDAAVDGSLDSNAGMKVLLGKSTEFGGEEPEARTVLKDELSRQTLEFLRARKARGERFDPGWFAEEANRAAEAVFRRYRTVIGDPDKLRRAPETAAGEDNLAERKPVPVPELERQDGPAEARHKALTWTTDVLERLARDAATGGASRA